MKTYRDPQSVMCSFAMGEPKPGNLQQIHNEILKKLDSMAHT